MENESRYSFWTYRAGVVGKRKFAYNLFGDTINTASRFETTSEPGKINISSSTYEGIQDRFSCGYEVKSKQKEKENWICIL